MHVRSELAGNSYPPRLPALALVVVQVPNVSRLPFASLPLLPKPISQLVSSPSSSPLDTTANPRRRRPPRPPGVVANQEEEEIGRKADLCPSEGTGARATRGDPPALPASAKDTAEAESAAPRARAAGAPQVASLPYHLTEASASLAMATAATRGS
ncbi:uncharacterized protein LOC124673672 [Lolium rigidum]|uniref:uncharacterized protein LOC124673672 n=1 Tax=Lolium rigidum TaxID=89674 RepID=UPI001F5D6CEB|nr:uncharacterized protein LOC124673672 [Lolium rigidum]